MGLLGNVFTQNMGLEVHLVSGMFTQNVYLKDVNQKHSASVLLKKYFSQISKFLHRLLTFVLFQTFMTLFCRTEKERFWRMLVFVVWIQNDISQSIFCVYRKLYWDFKLHKEAQIVIVKIFGNSLLHNNPFQSWTWSGGCMTRIWARKWLVSFSCSHNLSGCIPQTSYFDYSPRDEIMDRRFVFLPLIVCRRSCELLG